MRVPEEPRRADPQHRGDAEHPGGVARLRPEDGPDVRRRLRRDPGRPEPRDGGRGRGRCGSAGAVPNSPRYVHPRLATAISPSGRRSPPRIVTAPTTRSAPKTSARTSSLAIPFWSPPTQRGVVARPAATRPARGLPRPGAGAPSSRTGSPRPAAGPRDRRSRRPCRPGPGAGPTGTSSVTTPRSRIPPDSRNLPAVAGVASSVTGWPLRARSAAKAWPSDPAPTRASSPSARRATRHGGPRWRGRRRPRPAPPPSRAAGCRGWGCGAR